MGGLSDQRPHPVTPHGRKIRRRTGNRGCGGVGGDKKRMTTNDTNDFIIYMSVRGQKSWM